MKITLQNAGKRFSREWIFRNLNYEFLPGTIYAITGPNGSGKSTLLQVLSGALLLNEGSCECHFTNTITEPDDVHFLGVGENRLLHLVEIADGLDQEEGVAAGGGVQRGRVDGPVVHL